MNEFNDEERVARANDTIVYKVLNSREEILATGLVIDEADDQYYEAEDGDEDSDWFEHGIVDAEAEAEIARQEAQIRLHAQSNEIKRFHDKICERVTARERQNRLEAQRAQKYLDAKCAKLFSTTESIQQTRQTEHTSEERVSTRPHFQKLKEEKSAILKGCPLGKQIEKILRLDAQIREDLLRSTEISRSQDSISVENQSGENDSDESEPDKSPVLLRGQRVALYATVRRQYMQMERVNVQNNACRGDSQPLKSGQVKPSLSNASVAAAARGSRARRANNPEHRSRGGNLVTPTGVKVIDITGCDVRVHRQTATSMKPWRKKSAKSPTAQGTKTERERFVRALQAQLGTPPLCSCSKPGPDSTSTSDQCANNCALYNQPKKREKLLASVYKQQQQDATTVASSPIG